MPNILPNMLQCWSWIFMFSHDLLKLFTSSFPTKHEFQLHISMSELWILLTNTNPAKQENNEEIPKKHVFPSFFALLQSYNSLLQRGLTSLLPAIGHKAEHPPPPCSFTAVHHKAPCPILRIIWSRGGVNPPTPYKISKRAFINTEEPVSSPRKSCSLMKCSVKMSFCPGVGCTHRKKKRLLLLLFWLWQ